MRSIQINFNSENQLPDGNCLGNKGEHNATELVITPPAEMLNSDKVKCFVIVFQVGAHKLFRSDVHGKSEIINYKLPREITVANEIAIQLEGYDSEEELIVKSDVIENLYFNNSICGEETNGEVSKSLSGEIAANTAARHTHENADVLGNLADDNGTLTYNGNPIGGSAERPTAEYVYDFINGNSNMFYTVSSSEIFLYMPKDVLIDTDVEWSLIGKEISNIEFERASGEWVSIKNMSEIDLNPHISQINHIISQTVDEMESIVFVSVFYPSNAGWLYTEIVSNAISKIKVTYYTD